MPINGSASFEIPAGWLEPAYLEEIAANHSMALCHHRSGTEYFNHGSDVAYKLLNGGTPPSTVVETKSTVALLIVSCLRLLISLRQLLVKWILYFYPGSAKIIRVSCDDG